MVQESVLYAPFLGEMSMSSSDGDWTMPSSDGSGEMPTSDEGWAVPTVMSLGQCLQ